MKNNLDQFIDENETETLIKENNSKWLKQEERGKRLLILGSSLYSHSICLQEKD